MEGVRTVLIHPPPKIFHFLPFWQTSIICHNTLLTHLLTLSHLLMVKQQLAIAFAWSPMVPTGTHRVFAMTKMQLPSRRV